jgi:hypothetical protein
MPIGSPGRMGKVAQRQQYVDERHRYVDERSICVGRVVRDMHVARQRAEPESAPGS